MQKFIDKQNNLIWINYNNTSNDNLTFVSFIKDKFSHNNYKSNTMYQDSIFTLNSWETKDNTGNIKKFINPKSNLQLGDYFNHKYFLPTTPEYCKDTTCNFNQFFAYTNTENPILIGTAILNHCQNNTYKDYLEYLVVNPEFQRQGFGTQMLKSIIHNPKFFTQSKNPTNLIGYIHKYNTPSIKLVNKIGFDKFTFTSPIDEDYFNSSAYNTFIYDFKKPKFENQSTKEFL